MFLWCAVACEPAAETCEECQEVEPVSGKNLYLNHCASCHGEDGKLGNSGAKDLSKTWMSVNEIKEILNEGKGAMPPMLELVAEPSHMDAVVYHIITLRTE